MAFRLGVDVGGTFTDLLLVDESAGQTYMAKVLSTPEDSSIGVLTGIDRIRSPVAAKIAFVTAGANGGSAGSPNPVDALSLCRKCTSICGVEAIRMTGY